METNFNFKSSVCTDKNQSERLLALGLKKETADMVWTHAYYGTWVVTASENPLYEESDSVPSWSLHRLLCMLPKHIQVYDEEWKFKRNLYLLIDEDFNIRYEENIDEPCFDKTFWAYDIYQNCIDAIEWLIKEGYFNKEYFGGIVMPNHGYCKNCWWWKTLHTVMPHQVDETGKCYMHSVGASPEYTSEHSYCPDYYNRKKGNREQKQTLEEWIKEKGL